MEKIKKAHGGKRRGAGPKKKDEADRKSCPVTFNMTPLESKKVKELVEKTGCTLSEFVRSRVLGKT